MRSGFSRRTNVTPLPLPRIALRRCAPASQAGCRTRTSCAAASSALKPGAAGVGCCGKPVDLLPGADLGGQRDDGVLRFLGHALPFAAGAPGSASTAARREAREAPEQHRLLRKTVSRAPDDRRFHRCAGQRGRGDQLQPRGDQGYPGHDPGRRHQDRLLAHGPGHPAQSGGDAAGGVASSGRRRAGRRAALHRDHLLLFRFRHRDRHAQRHRFGPRSRRGHQRRSIRFLRAASTSSTCSTRSSAGRPCARV